MAVKVSGAEELKRLCQTKAKITQSPPKYTVVWKGSDEAVASERSSVRVAVRTELANGKPFKRKPVIGCQLRMQNNSRFRRECVLKFIKDHEYCILYSPPYSGRYELILTVNGVEVTDKSFSADWFWSKAMKFVSQVSIAQYYTFCPCAPTCQIQCN